MMENVAELLKFATNVAKRVWNDIEAESAAGNALFRALRTYDGRVSIKGWIAYCVRIEVQDHWRRFHYTSGRMKRTVQHKHDEYWLSVEVLSRTESPEEKSTVEFQEQFPYYWTLLVERFVEKVPLCALAHRRGTTIDVVKQNVEAGIRILTEYLGN